MKSLFRYSALLALLAAPPLSAEEVELFPFGNAEMEGLKTASGRPLERTSKDAKEGNSAYRLAKKTVIVLEPLIPVDVKKAYHLTATMRSVEADNLASANFGVYMYDEQQRLIAIRNVSAKKGTQTQLLKPLEAGSTEAWVGAAEGWRKPANNYRLAFDAKEDLSDLPNYTLSPRIEAVKKTDEGWKVTFSEPAKEAYPAGTEVRQHTTWPPGLYWVADGWVPATWTTYSTTLEGEAPSGTHKDKFWKGTRYVRVMLGFSNWNHVPKEGAELLVDEISFREVPAKGMNSGGGGE